MRRATNIIPFPGVRKRQRVERYVKNMDGIKYFNALQVKELRRYVRDRADIAHEKGRVTGVKEWVVIDLLTSTGLRVSETANLRCGDIKTGYGESAVFVRDGKGHRSRTVQMPESLKKHLKQFISWKKLKGEDTGPNDYLFVGQRGPWTAQAVQQIVKKYLKVRGMYENGKSVHALRHSYALEYYRRSGYDLRGLQKQLGHSSIQTTQIYADVTNEHIRENIKGMWSTS
jgi:site-specific recombinase XerD